MKNTKQIILLWIFYCLIIFSFHSVNASLPTKVEGQPLPSLADMLERTVPAVVNISTEGKLKQKKEPITENLSLRNLFGSNNHKMRGKASGVIIDADNGYVLTNYHVVFDSDKISVTLNDERKFEAKLMGGDSKFDIAILQIQGKFQNLVAMPIADSDYSRVGDFVVAIGHPYGLGQSVTSGIISALGRTNLGIEDYEDFIQTDASINPGNSGGALVNLNGELVGINTAILGGNGGGNIGIGFAIPSNMAMSIMKQIIEFGSVKRGQLGIEIRDISQEKMTDVNLKHRQGAIISNIIQNSPADLSGLKPDDVIIKINNKNIKNSTDVRNLIGGLRLGDKVKIQVIRKGQLKTLTVTLGEITDKYKKPQKADKPEILEIPIWENGLW